jgi:hypothetical protein
VESHRERVKKPAMNATKAIYVCIGKENLQEDAPIVKANQFQAKQGVQLAENESWETIGNYGKKYLRRMEDSNVYAAENP